MCIGSRHPSGDRPRGLTGCRGERGVVLGGDPGHRWAVHGLEEGAAAHPWGPSGHRQAMSRLSRGLGFHMWGLQIGGRQAGSARLQRDCGWGWWQGAALEEVLSLAPAGNHRQASLLECCSGTFFWGNWALCPLYRDETTRNCIVYHTANVDKVYLEPRGDELMADTVHLLAAQLPYTPFYSHGGFLNTARRRVPLSLLQAEMFSLFEARRPHHCIPPGLY